MPSRTFCYPFNARNDEVVKIAMENRVWTRTKQYAIGSRSTPEKLNQWVDSLIINTDWGVGMTHGINYGYDAFTSPNILWDHFDKVKSLQDKVWVGTFREVAAYIEERNHIQLDIRKEDKIWLVNPVLKLDWRLFNEPLTMVIEQENIRKITVKQDRKKLPVRILPDKAMFDFNPNGGTIHINIK